MIFLEAALGKLLSPQPELFASSMIVSPVSDN